MKLLTFILAALLGLLLTSSSFLSYLSGDANSVRFFESNCGTSSVGKVICVPDLFEKIQDAINNSTEGDVVLVRPGIYNENIVINKSISLIGTNQTTTILDGGRKSDVVTIDADNVVLAGFTIRNGNFPAQYGVRIQSRVNAIVQHNVIIDNFVGIELYYVTSSSIRWNHLVNNRYGIFLAHSVANVVYANNVSGNRWNGIELDWSDQNVIEANTVAFNEAYGFEIPSSNTPSQNNVIFHNNFLNNTLGVRAFEYLNVWSSSYPVGGNFWGSDIGVDLFSGPNQDQPGSDGIIDTPYVIGEYNVDHYPLLNRFHPTPPTTPIASFNFLPRNPCVDDVVAFNVSLVAPPEQNVFSFFWDFGDGTRGQGENTTHKYSSVGAFLVELYVIDSEEGLLAVKSRFVVVEAQFQSDLPYVAIGITAAVGVVVAFYYNKARKKTLSHHLQKEEAKNKKAT